MIVGMPPTRAATRAEYVQPLRNGVATSNSLYKEIDGVYTLFFKDNKVAWQIGASYLIAGQMLDQLAAGNAAGKRSVSAVNSIWAYTQLHVNF